MNVVVSLVNLCKIHNKVGGCSLSRSSLPLHFGFHFVLVYSSSCLFICFYRLQCMPCLSSMVGSLSIPFSKVLDCDFVVQDILRDTDSENFL